MKPILHVILFCALAICTRAQDTTLVFSKDHLGSDQYLLITTKPGWVFKKGHNPTWSQIELSTQGWQDKNPANLEVESADMNGRIEGWFRFRLRLDSTFTGIPIGIKKGSWAAVDVYIDGELVQSYGNTGRNGDSFKEDSPILTTARPLQLEPLKDHLLALHVVDDIFHHENSHFQGSSFKYLVFMTLPGFNEKAKAASEEESKYFYICISVSLILSFLLWLLYFLKLYEKRLLLLLTLAQTAITIQIAARHVFHISDTFLGNHVSLYVSAFSLGFTEGITFLATATLLGITLPSWSKLLVLLPCIIGSLCLMYSEYEGYYDLYFMPFLSFIIFSLIFYRWRNVKGSEWALIAGIMGRQVFFLIPAILLFLKVSYSLLLFYTLALLTFPFSFMVFVSWRIKEILQEIQENANRIVQVTEEKKEIIANQNQLLEKQVEARTAELKASQSQLIQKEKLASLGELTAGIAHEIQNPLNFVNNYSEVNVELIKELQEEVEKGDTSEIKAILADLSDNERKIHHHGRRADAIVRGMLEHARATPGEKAPTDLNALADEYLRLAYHGLRAKDSDFQCELITNFDPNLGKVEVAPSELGRVLLNLFNNAFYAVRQRAMLVADQAYVPTVWVSTYRLAGKVEIEVRDNGTGMPEEIKAKIFQPFFTTKPTGEGTGLGLSLSYDIVTKGHGGALRVESCVGEGTEFVVVLPNP